MHCRWYLLTSVSQDEGRLNAICAQPDSEGGAPGGMSMPGWWPVRGANCGAMGWWPIPPAGGGPMPMCGPTMPGGKAPGCIMYGGGAMRYGGCTAQSQGQAHNMG